MDSGGRRRAGGRSSSVVAGSVWETRMKRDEVRGGFKVFNGEYCSNNEHESNGNVDGESTNSSKRLSLKKGQNFGGVAVSGKRKTWNEGIEKNQIQIGKPKRSPVLPKKEISEGSERSPIQMKKVGSNVLRKVKSDSVKLPDDKNSGQLRKVKSGNIKVLDDSDKNGCSSCYEDSDDKLGALETEKSGSGQLRKVKSGNIKVLDDSDRNDGSSCSEDRDEKLGALETEKSGSGQLRKVISGNIKVLDDSDKNGCSSCSEDSDEKLGAVETETSGSEENCKEFGVISIAPTQLVDEEEHDDDEEFYEEEEEEEEVELEGAEPETESETEKKADIKEMDVQEQKSPVSVSVSVAVPVQEQKPVKVANQVTKFSQFKDKTQPFSSTLHKQPPPVVRRATPIYITPAKPTPISDDRHGFPQTQSKLQNLVDLIMWRDASKSAFIFGIGTFIIISSSYTKDLNISFISVSSYVGLVYLAAIFLYRSLICRGIVVDMDDRSYVVVGEEEAVWLLELFLPYLNEFLLKLKALFSGDPSTTMKLAVLLFVLARCGNSITIWKMAKLGFFGVFIVPKACSSYSHQLTAYGKFWIRRFRDAWNSCMHKKAVAILIFTVFWNFSSIVARIWAAFMLYVALRYYQQKVVMEECVVEEAAKGVEESGRNSTWRGRVGRSRTGLGHSRVEPVKAKKAS